jgi:hypothetical protein
MHRASGVGRVAIVTGGLRFDGVRPGAVKWAPLAASHQNERRTSRDDVRRSIREIREIRR